ncbi:uncharacterized protein LOC132718450 [Ruditapes philippinarum]|uniref:uncharacterized protein LOC132718450 n=1 Tax=Ruditapes philippinarum TaxID=129788 RepID=UPI00295AF9A8|nr:uncharacterized protein LOC132718450 [Ruditapes philippinarum]
MPFDDATFDAILFSQVLHHLDTNDDINESQRFEQLGHAIAEAGRVLCQNGTMFIMASTPDDIMNSWYNHLNMEISRKYVKKFASIHQFLDLFTLTGFTCIQKMKLLGSVLVDYDNAEGPLNKAWRDSDSYWAIANEKEIKDVEQKINALKKDGKVKDFVEKHDRVHTNGIATLFVCKNI